MKSTLLNSTQWWT